MAVNGLLAEAKHLCECRARMALFDGLRGIIFTADDCQARKGADCRGRGLARGRRVDGSSVSKRCLKAGREKTQTSGEHLDALTVLGLVASGTNNLGVLIGPGPPAPPIIGDRTRPDQLI